jgi:hypothetical protein
VQVIQYGGIPRSGVGQLIYEKDEKFLTFSSVNGGPLILVDQPNTGGGHVVLSAPVQLNLRSGTNSITFSANQNSKFYKPLPKMT